MCFFSLQQIGILPILQQPSNNPSNPSNPVSSVSIQSEGSENKITDCSVTKDPNLDEFYQQTSNEQVYINNNYLSDSKQPYRPDHSKFSFESSNQVTDNIGYGEVLFNFFKLFVFNSHLERPKNPGDSPCVLQGCDFRTQCVSLRLGQFASNNPLIFLE